MIRLRQNPETGYWTATDDPRVNLVQVHGINECRFGCAIHDRPSNHPLKDAPLYWRDDRGILERTCEHGIGHIDFDTAIYNRSINMTNLNIHGCDGCCGIP